MAKDLALYGRSNSTRSPSIASVQLVCGASGSRPVLLDGANAVHKDGNAFALLCFLPSCLGCQPPSSALAEQVGRWLAEWDPCWPSAPRPACRRASRSSSPRKTSCGPAIGSPGSRLGNFGSRMRQGSRGRCGSRGRRPDLLAAQQWNCHRCKRTAPPRNFLCGFLMVRIWCFFYHRR